MAADIIKVTIVNMNICLSSIDFHSTLVFQILFTQGIIMSFSLPMVWWLHYLNIKSFKKFLLTFDD